MWCPFKEDRRAYRSNRRQRNNNSKNVNLIKLLKSHFNWELQITKNGLFSSKKKKNLFCVFFFVLTVFKNWKRKKKKKKEKKKNSFICPSLLSLFFCKKEKFSHQFRFYFFPAIFFYSQRLEFMKTSKMQEIWRSCYVVSNFKWRELDCILNPGFFLGLNTDR